MGLYRSQGGLGVFSSQLAAASAANAAALPGAIADCISKSESYAGDLACKNGTIINGVFTKGPAVLKPLRGGRRTRRNRRNRKTRGRTTRNHR